VMVYAIPSPFCGLQRMFLLALENISGYCNHGGV